MSIHLHRHSQNRLREQISTLGKSLFDRGLTMGSSGNISVRLDDGGWLMTPTNACLGRLDPARISHLDNNGQLLSGDKPTKEQFLHMAMYEERPRSGAIVHLHSTPLGGSLVPAGRRSLRLHSATDRLLRDAGGQAAAGAVSHSWRPQAGRCSAGVSGQA